ncbi:hypothetical protein [Burkholderia contaminans]|uniref:hypothetical protein n=1 Tax=Burkholderia contaminans TaxID=488447 RepID=UPI0021AB1375|nr:hypothetical protein [Burkholderia contaminans]
MLDRPEAIRGTKECLSVFTPKCGTHDTHDGFRGCRGKLMSEMIEAKVIAGRFAFHDLRAYYATRHESEHGALPDLHANPATTARCTTETKSESAWNSILWNSKTKTALSFGTVPFSTT